MRRLIEGYQNFPGEHCGSVAMRGLLHHYCGLSLPEPAVFGLGSGAAAVYLSGPGVDPAAVLFGRTFGMEQDLAANLQLDYREHTESDDDEAWRVVREEVLEGRPTMLSGDILYLDYREFKVHFPAHRFVLLGFDDEAKEVYIADRIRPEHEVCSAGALRDSRNPPEGISTQNLWGRFHDTTIGAELVDAARAALKRNVHAMLGDTPPSSAGGDAGPAVDPGSKSVQGIAGIRAYAEDLPSWCGRDDAHWIASFNASCLEKFGNGGGNFRRLYSGFLSWARSLDATLVAEDAPALATAAADAWTATSDALYAASKEPANPGPWKTAAECAARAGEIEERLFSGLADRVA